MPNQRVTPGLCDRGDHPRSLPDFLRVIFAGAPRMLMNGTIMGMLIIVFPAIAILGCAQSQEKHYPNPNEYLVKQLSTRRIVMLADFYHSAPLPFETLTSLLNEWVDDAASGKSKDRNVVLILEDDKQIVDNLKGFISTGDWKPLVDFWLPYNTMEWLEFCADLRELHLRIDSLNGRRAAAERIYLDIFGAESANVLDRPSDLGRTTAEGARYFVEVRDSLSSGNICAYLKGHPHTKAIVFYGMAHLIGSYVHKDAPALPYSETGGYYVAHYLKEKFGKDSVMTVAQVTAGRVNRKCWLYHIAGQADVFVPGSEISANDINLFGLRPDYFDGFITRRESLIIGHSLGAILSRRVVEADIRRLTFLKNLLPGALAERYTQEALESLRFITGKDFKSPEEWRAWFQKSRYDGLKRLNSPAFLEEAAQVLSGGAAQQALRMNLYDLGLSPGILNPNLKYSQDQWEDILRVQVKSRMKLYECIGLLWVGTEEEKVEAKRYLVETFGEPLKAPQYYLKSDRQHFFHANY